MVRRIRASQMQNVTVVEMYIITHLVLHLKALLKLDPPPPGEAGVLLERRGVAFMYKEAGEAACAGVEIFVRAPRREVDYVRGYPSGERVSVRVPVGM